MAEHLVAHVVTTARTYKGKTYRTHLLRRSYREGGQVKKETLANLTPLGDSIVGIVREALQGQAFVRVEDVFDIVASRHHGHGAAVVRAFDRLKLDSLLGPRCQQRQIVLAMIAARIIDPRSKLATVNCFGNTTIPELLGLSDVAEDDLYGAMDWLLERQEQIENKLAKRHLKEGALALYDLSSSYFEGHTCPLAALGYSRDRKRGKLQVNYGLLTDRRGCPVALSVFKGNVSDTKTFQPQVESLQHRYGLTDFVLVGDRGMITQKQVDLLRSENLKWITALRPGAIRKLLADRTVQPELFDERNLVEVEHVSFPNERLMVCRNPALAKLRAATRQSLLESTCKSLEKIQEMVRSGRLRGADKIGLRVGRDINKYKVAKHMVIEVKDAELTFRRNEPAIAEEAALDGLYVVRTNLPAETMPRAEVVRSYKQLSQVERSFRSMKTMDLHVRPIFHRTEPRVRAHIFLCMLAYYVRWHLLECWRPLLFCDEELDAKLTRDPVAPATRSASADDKAQSKHTVDGDRVHSFRTLIENLGTMTRNTCRPHSVPAGHGSFTLDTRPSPLQQRALDLINTMHS